MMAILYILAFVLVVVIVCGAVVFVSNPKLFKDLLPKKQTLADLIELERAKLKQAEDDRRELQVMLEKRRSEMENAERDKNTLEARIKKFFADGDDDKAESLESRYNDECDDYDNKTELYEKVKDKYDRAVGVIDAQRRRVREAEDAVDTADLDKRLADLERDHYENDDLEAALNEKQSAARRSEIKRDLAKGSTDDVERNKKFQQAGSGAAEKRKKRMEALRNAAKE